MPAVKLVAAPFRTGGPNQPEPPTAVHDWPNTSLVRAKLTRSDCFPHPHCAEHPLVRTRLRLRHEEKSQWSHVRSAVLFAAPGPEAGTIATGRWRMRKVVPILSWRKLPKASSAKVRAARGLALSHALASNPEQTVAMPVPNPPHGVAPSTRRSALGVGTKMRGCAVFTLTCRRLSAAPQPHGQSRLRRQNIGIYSGYCRFG